MHIICLLSECHDFPLSFRLTVAILCLVEGSKGKELTYLGYLDILEA